MKMSAPLSQPHTHSLFFYNFENTTASIRNLSQEALIQLSSSQRDILRHEEEYICIYLMENW